MKLARLGAERVTTSLERLVHLKFLTYLDSEETQRERRRESKDKEFPFEPGLLSVCCVSPRDFSFRVRHEKEFAVS
jgi:hypothetical protein